jgi:DNA-binding NtrC family response regulator
VGKTATQQPVLLSWIAQANDPFNRSRDAEPRTDGPTLTVLFDGASPYVDQIRDVVLLYRDFGDDTTKERAALDRTIAEINARAPAIVVHRESWPGADPTDHDEIYKFLRATVPKVRSRFPGRELIIHVSPGTSSMQTIWVLMGSTGLIDPPFRLVKSYRPDERKGGPSVVPVGVELDTFYKAYARSRPRDASASEPAASWDPRKLRSEPMRRLFDEARRYAQINVPILLLGERGTGKSTLASWIRTHSNFRKPELDKRWPSIACGQYDANTMRAELFGYVKGAFTDAKKNKDGQLKAAQGDTLFLDEIGDVSRDLQRLLIKALEEKRFMPLGADELVESEFRLLTATNLDDATLRERLDPDFLDRISMVTLRLPALREIPEEIEWLWPTIFANAFGRVGAQRVRELSPERNARVVDELRKHPLRGNFRDLYRLAYRIIAALVDDHQPLGEEQAVEYGLELLTLEQHRADNGRSRALALAFAGDKLLDELVTLEQPLVSDELFNELQRFIATEIRRLASERGVKPEQLCDVTARTLRDWGKK